MKNLSLSVMFLSLVLGMNQANSLKASDGIDLGDKVPHFSALDEKGEKWDSAQHVGKKIIVVYFYPADMTGGCTKQACAFRDDLPGFKKKNVEVIGVSGDTVKNHQLFTRAHQLNFTLLADTKGEIAKTFGVPTRKGGSIQRTIENEEFTLTRELTTARWTFVIGLDGKIAHKNTTVKAAQDSKAVMKIINNLK